MGNLLLGFACSSSVLLWSVMESILCGVGLLLYLLLHEGDLLLCLLCNMLSL